MTMEPSRLEPRQQMPRKIRILVIDDSASARIAIGNTLASLGYDVLLLASAIGATRTILRNDVRAVIIDVTMPGLSGDKLVELLRSNPKLANLVVILVSGNEDCELDRLGIGTGAHAVLPKSAIQTQLGSVLQRFLRTFQQHSGPVEIEPRE